MIKKIKYMTLFSLLIFSVFLGGCGDNKEVSLAQVRAVSPITTQECAFLNDGSCINDDEELEIYESYARLDESTQNYTLELRGWIYEPNTSAVARSTFLALLETEVGITPTLPLDINSRIDPFLADNQSDEIIKVAIGSVVYSLNASLSSGYLSGDIEISSQQAESIFEEQGTNQYISYNILLPAEDNRIFSGTIDLVSNDGVIIVSDVDDTIKVSEVYISESRLLENIFYNEEKSVPGMNTFLQRLKNENESPLFFYVSGSPKQMYKSITSFLEKENFPPGYIYLKDFQLSPFTSAFYTFLDSDSTYEHKLKKIRALFKEFPRREFILVGDSGEKDPEVYGKLFEEYESRIKSIHIQNVTGESLDNQRFKDIFPISTSKIFLL